MTRQYTLNEFIFSVGRPTSTRCELVTELMLVNKFCMKTLGLLRVYGVLTQYDKFLLCATKKHTCVKNQINLNRLLKRNTL